MSRRHHTPVLIIGAGLAGGIVALRLADKGIPVTILAASAMSDNGNSWQAQGGIIYRSLDKDDAKKLENDIFIAGHNYNNPETVRFLCQYGPQAVEEMLVDRLGIPFDRANADDKGVFSNNDWDLTREGGHSTQRIIHCADHTGRSIMDYLLSAVKNNPNITYLENHTAIDLLTAHHHAKDMKYHYDLYNKCCGAYVYDETTKEILTFLADTTVIATGGVGQVYLHSTNAQSAVGSGIAMASRAFVRLENMEFMQFHPTTFFQPDRPSFLITEALRGEGALLFNSAGKRFMPDYDERAELAPRDIVSRAIVHDMLSTGDACVYLDARKVKHDLKKRFPTVFEACLERGIDIRKQLIPVVPAAHYFCGGILTNLKGQTSLEGLYCAGESSCTGLHGANRLASTSLLEALLFGKTAGDHIAQRIFNADITTDKTMQSSIKDWEYTGSDQHDDPALIAQDWNSIRTLMWNYVGITRTTARLDRAFAELRDLSRNVHGFYKNTAMSKPLIDLFHGCQTAYLITQAAQRNRESIGCHYRL